MLNLIAQRRKLLITGESRVQKRTALEAIQSIEPYLLAYQYNDANMARFIVNHYHSIALILPGEGSSCHQARMNELLNIYNSAVVINTEAKMKRYNYYQVTNEHAEAWIKTSVSDCTLFSLSYEGKVEIRQYDTSFKRFNSDVIVEITKDYFIKGCQKVMEQIVKSVGL